jgi:hypothetical protein
MLGVRINDKKSGKGTYKSFPIEELRNRFRVTSLVK